MSDDFAVPALVRSWFMSAPRVTLPVLLSALPGFASLALVAVELSDDFVSDGLAEGDEVAAPPALPDFVSDGLAEGDEVAAPPALPDFESDGLPEGAGVLESLFDVSVLVPLGVGWVVLCGELVSLDPLELLPWASAGPAASVVAATSASALVQILLIGFLLLGCCETSRLRRR